MGASKSKSSLEVVNESVIDVITDHMNKCSSSLKAVQDNTLSGVDIFGKNVQTVSLDQRCTQTANIDNQMIAEMANKIQQQANAKTVALLPGYSGSQNTQNLRNYLASKVTTRIVQDAMASVEAAQLNVVATGGISIGRTNTQTITSVQTALQDVLNSNRVAQGITVDTSQSSTASTDTNPISQIFAAITDSIMGWIFIVILFIVLIVVSGLVLKKLLGSGGDAPVIAVGPNLPEESSALSIGEGGILLGPTGQPMLDDIGVPIYVSEEGISLDGMTGQPQMLGDRQVFVDKNGMKVLVDGTPVRAADLAGYPSMRVDEVSEDELRAMAQVGEPVAA